MTKKPLSSSFKKNVAYECSIFHLINDTQNGGTLCPKFYLFILVFMNHVQTKNHDYQHKMKKNLKVFLSTCTPIKQNNKTPFMENSKTKL
jgi:hypothetical protein